MRRALVLAICVAGCGGSSEQPDLGVLDFSVADLSLPAATVLAPAQTLTTCLAVDATSVYWIESDGKVMKVALGGGTPSTIATGADKSSCVVVDGNGAYFASTSGGFATLYRTPLAGGDGGQGAVLASMQHPLPEGKAFYALQGGQLYFVTDVYGPADMAFNGKSAIVRVATSGGPPEVVFSDVMGDPGGLAVDATSYFFSDMNGVFAAPRTGGGTPAALGMSVIKRNAFVVSSMNLAMAEVTGVGMGDVAVMRLDGTQRTVLLDRLITPLAIDDKGVYVNLDGHLTRLSLDGKSQLSLAAAQARAAVTDASSVYFTDGASILKVGR